MPKIEPLQAHQLPIDELMPEVPAITVIVAVDWMWTSELEGCEGCPRVSVKEPHHRELNSC